MPLASLRPVLEAAEARRGAALGLVCLGWDDALAFVRAGEAAGVPVILQAGPAARRAIPVAVWGAIFRTLGEGAAIDVVAHLDHGASAEECFEALDHGFTSVMFDGSRLPLAENIRQTARVIDRAARFGASTEAEIGFVGYDAGAASRGTDPSEAASFYENAPTDCLAVSVGNVHLQQSAEQKLDFERLRALNAALDCPLVLHGGSGTKEPDRRRAISAHRVRKINLGTQMRQVHGQALRETLARDPALFDRIKIQEPVTAAIAQAAQGALKAAWDAAL